ncbi:MAG: type II toxin-antitoxin system VapC family toxin [Treponema sp.]|jgi:PIN domain nuclease of toxin-antitoxin system|nr:type II toxin-antitoxin system VapC family toxin [Treponema sp.]
MTRYLLDTHTAMWFLNGDNSLSKTAKETILNLSNTKYISIVSAWEIAIKLSIGKLDIVKSTAEFLQDAEENGFLILPINPAYLTGIETLPMIHRDPFDRILIATAITEEMTLITDDDNISKYDVSYIW